MKLVAGVIGSFFAGLLVVNTGYAHDSGVNSRSAETASGLIANGSDLFVATTGEVILTFLSKEAGYSNDLFLSGNSNAILNNQTAIPGTEYALGNFVAGTKLTFEMFVNNVGQRYFTGSGSINPDGVIHAAYKQTSPQSFIIGFEDLFNGGDRDYNDLIFSLNNVTLASPVAEPETLGMFMAGLGIIGAMRRRRQS